MTPESVRPRARQRTGLALTTTVLCGLIVTFDPVTAATAAPPPGMGPMIDHGAFQTVETQESDIDGDGVVDELWTWVTEYDANGNLRSASASRVNLATAEQLYFHTSEWTYDDSGRLVFSITEAGFGDDVEQREITEQFYDDRGNLSLIVRHYDMDADGTAETTETVTVEGGERSLTSRTTTVWAFALDDLPPSTITITTERDRRGNVLAIIESTDFETDSMVDMLLESHFTYSPRGAITSETGSTQGFGEYSEWIEPSSYAVTYEYNARGLMSRFQSVSTISPTFTQTFAYTSRGELAAYTSSVDYEGDGVADELAVGSATYDSRGRLVSGVLEVTSPSGMGAPYVQRTVATYDTRGTQTQTVEEDYDADGLADARTHVATTRDSRGHVIAESIEVDADANGEADLSISFSATYSRAGALLSRTSTFDTDGDGIPEETYTFTRSAL